MSALTRPLPAIPWLGRALLASAFLLPLFVGNGMALLASALLLGLGLRTQGRLVFWPPDPPPTDPVALACVLGVVVWCSGLFYFAIGGLP